MRTAQVSGGPQKYRTDVSVGAHKVVTDEPLEEGGQDLGPTPKELLLGALGACTSITVRLYAARKGMKLESVDVALHLESQPGQKVQIHKRVTLVGVLTDDERKRLLQVAERCPVNRMLVEGVDVRAEGA